MLELDIRHQMKSIRALLKPFRIKCQTSNMDHFKRMIMYTVISSVCHNCYLVHSSHHIFFISVPKATALWDCLTLSALGMSLFVPYNLHNFSSRIVHSWSIYPVDCIVVKRVWTATCEHFIWFCAWCGFQIVQRISVISFGMFSANRCY